MLVAGRLQAPRRLRGLAEDPGRKYAARRHHRGSQEVLAARARRRRVPDRPEVVVHAAFGAGAEIPAVQFRRVGAGHLPRPRSAALQPARGHRGHGHRLLCNGRDDRLQLSSRRVPPRAVRALRGGPEGSLRSRPAGQGHQRFGRRRRHSYGAGRGRLHLRRGNRADGIAGRQEGPAAFQAAVPGQFRDLRQADDDQQHRNARLGACHHAQRRRLVPGTGQAQQRRAEDIFGLRARQQAGQPRDSARHAVCRPARNGRRHA